MAVDAGSRRATPIAGGGASALARRRFAASGTAGRRRRACCRRWRRPGCRRLSHCPWTAPATDPSGAGSFGSVSVLDGRNRRRCGGEIAGAAAVDLLFPRRRRDRQRIAGGGDQHLAGDPNRRLVARGRVAVVAVAGLPGGEVVEGAAGRRSATLAGSAPTAIIPCTAQAVDCELTAARAAEGEAAVGALVLAQVGEAALGRLRARASPASPSRSRRRCSAGPARRPSRRRRSERRRSQESVLSRPPLRRRRAGRSTLNEVVPGQPSKEPLSARRFAQLLDQVAAGEGARVDAGALEGDDRAGEVAGAAHFVEVGAQEVDRRLADGGRRRAGCGRPPRGPASPSR